MNLNVVYFGLFCSDYARFFSESFHSDLLRDDVISRLKENGFVRESDSILGKLGHSASLALLYVTCTRSPALLVQMLCELEHSPKMMHVLLHSPPTGEEEEDPWNRCDRIDHLLFTTFFGLLRAPSPSTDQLNLQAFVACALPDMISRLDTCISPLEYLAHPDHLLSRFLSVLWLRCGGLAYLQRIWGSLVTRLSALHDKLDLQVDLSTIIEELSQRAVDQRDHVGRKHLLRAPALDYTRFQEPLCPPKVEPAISVDSTTSSVASTPSTLVMANPLLVATRAPGMIFVVGRGHCPSFFSGMRVCFVVCLFAFFLGCRA